MTARTLEFESHRAVLRFDCVVLALGTLGLVTSLLQLQLERVARGVRCDSLLGPRSARSFDRTWSNDGENLLVTSFLLELTVYPAIFRS
jgi:hypothetical protein